MIKDECGGKGVGLGAPGDQRLGSSHWREQLTVEARISWGQQPSRKLLHTRLSLNLMDCLPCSPKTLSNQMD